MKRFLLVFLAMLILSAAAGGALAAKAGYGNLAWLTANTSSGVSTTHMQWITVGGRTYQHEGIDLASYIGMELYAPYSGTVYYTQKWGYIGGVKHLTSYGNMALLLSDELGENGTCKYALKLCHLSEYPEQFNDFMDTDLRDPRDGNSGRSSTQITTYSNPIGHFHIEAGELIGKAGNTGNSTGPHCHVELHLDATLTSVNDCTAHGTQVDPLDYIKRDISAKELQNRFSGQVDMVSTDNGSLRLMGWALAEKKPQNAVKLRAVVNVGGRETTNTFSTTQYRSDIAGGVGNHGFDIGIPLGATGSGSVTLYMEKQDGTLQQIGDHAYRFKAPDTGLISIDGTSLGYRTGEEFRGTFRFKKNQKDFALWAESVLNGVTSKKAGCYRTTTNVNELGIEWWMRPGCVLYLRDGKTIVAIDNDDLGAVFLMMDDSCTLRKHAVSWEFLPVFLNNMHGGVASAEVWEHVGTSAMEGACEVTTPCQNGVQVSGWVTTDDINRNIDIVITIADASVTMPTTPRDGTNSFSWLLSTNCSGNTRVTVTARNSNGDNLTLFAGTVNIPSSGVNRDCIICLDSPKGNHRWDALPEIAGWIAANTDIAGISAYGIDGLGSIDLTDSLRDASYELDNAGYGAYTFKKRFYYKFNRNQFIPRGTQTLSVTATFTDGSRSEPVSTSFSLDTLVLRDGTNMRTWLSGTPGGPEADSWNMDEPVYVCYRLTDVLKGWGVDTAHPEYTYTVRVNIEFPNGTTRSHEFSNDENWLLIPTDLSGTYTITISASGDADVDPQTQQIYVPVQVQPQTHMWQAWSAYDTADIAYEDYVGGTYYGCYELLDRRTNRPVNESAGYYDYTVTLELLDPYSNVTASKTFYNADRGVFAFTLEQEGSHSFRLTANGNIGGLDACEYNWTRGFTAMRIDPYVGVFQYIDDWTRTYRMPAIYTQEPGIPEVFCVYKHGWVGSRYDYRFTKNNDNVRCTWVSDLNRSNGQRMLQVTALGEGQTKITLELYDTLTGEVYATSNLYINGEIPTYVVTFDANGGSNTPPAGSKRKGEDYKLPNTFISHPGHETDYVFRGWSSDPEAQVPEYLPGGYYTYDADVTLYAVFERGDRYTYDTNGGKNGPEPYWHSELLETRPFRLSNVQPTRLGYIFRGWSLSPTATAASYSAGGTCPLQGSHTFYAVWERDSSMVAFGELSDTVEWVLEQNGVLSIRGSGAMPNGAYSGTHPWDEYTIGTLIVEEGITKIGGYAFQNMTALTDVTLPNTLTEISYYAFSNCTALPGLRVPDSVTTLGGSAFSGCTSITSFTIGDNVKSVGNGLFNYCTALREVRLGASLTSLPDGVFRYCTSLTEFTVPGRISRVGGYAFAYCTGLTKIVFEEGVQQLGGDILEGASSLVSVRLPQTLTVIHSGAFAGCSSLTTLTLPDGLSEIEGSLFARCSKLETLRIPEGVTSIGKWAFQYCYALTDIEIPQSVTSIGASAFASCDALVRLSLPSTVTSLGDYCFKPSGLRYVILPAWETQFGASGANYADITFYGLSGSDTEAFCLANGYPFMPIVSDTSAWTVENGTITAYRGTAGDVVIPAGLGATAIGEGVFRDNGLITSLTIEAPIRTIGASAFRGCFELRSITLPDTLAEIREYAFDDCAKLRTIEYDGSDLVSISTAAFMDCPKLEGIALPEGLATIGASAFKNCFALRDVTLPSSLTSLGTSAFYRTDLRQVTVPGGVGTVPGNCFDYCPSLAQVTLEDGISEIEGYAFLRCYSLTTVRLPQTLTAIGREAFGTSGLRSIHIPASVTELPEDLFSNCHQLQSVSLERCLTSIGSRAFRNCEMLATLELPDTLTAIGREAFMNAGICFLTIPGSVETLGAQALKDATRLEKLVLQPGVKTIENTALSGMTSLATIAIPYTVTSLQTSIFTDCTALATLLTSEDCYADKWFQIYEPDVAIEYLWGPVVVSGIELNRTEYQLRWLSSITLKATVTSEYARNKNVIWTSSSPEQVSVDQNGKVTAKRCSCSALITATTEDGGYKAYCWVTVPESTLSLDFLPRGGGTLVIQTVVMKPGAVFGELPTVSKPGWTFEGWHRVDDDSLVEPGVAIGWPAKNYLEIYANYTAGETLEEIVLYLGRDGLCTLARLPERFLALQAGEGATVTPAGESVVSIAQDGLITALGAGNTQIEVHCTDGGFAVQPLRVEALSSGLTLPADLTTVETEAFLNDTALQAVYLSDGTQRIEARAFAGCANLKLVLIPASVTSIAEDAFDADFSGTVCCKAGSDAEAWCEAHSVNCIAG